MRGKGYLNNAIRILFQRSINAFRLSVFVVETPEMQAVAGVWELNGRGIDEGGYLGDRSIRRVRGGLAGMNWVNWI